MEEGSVALPRISKSFGRKKSEQKNRGLGRKRQKKRFPSPKKPTESEKTESEKRERDKEKKDLKNGKVEN